MAVDGRLFGMPSYIGSTDASLRKDKLRLSLSRVDVPVEAWDSVINLSGIWDLVLNDRRAQKAFLSSPRRFLQDHGIAQDVLNADSQEVRLLKLVCDPYVRHVAASGQYREFIAQLQKSDVLHADADDSLSQQIRELMQSDLTRMRELVSSAKVGFVGDVLGSQNTADLYFLTEQLVGASSSLSESNAAATAAVVILAAAVVVVVVAVGVGISVSVGVSGCTNCHADLGALANIEPKMRENLDTVIRAARLTGQSSIEVEALKDFVATESRLCLEVADEMDLIQLPNDSKARTMVLQAVARLGQNAMGLL